MNGSSNTSPDGSSALMASHIGANNSNNSMDNHHHHANNGISSHKSLLPPFSPHSSKDPYAQVLHNISHLSQKLDRMASSKDNNNSNNNSSSNLLRSPHGSGKELASNTHSNTASSVVVAVAENNNNDTNSNASSINASPITTTTAATTATTVAMTLTSSSPRHNLNASPEPTSKQIRLPTLLVANANNAMIHKRKTVRISADPNTNTNTDTNSNSNTNSLTKEGSTTDLRTFSNTGSLVMDESVVLDPKTATTTVTASNIDCLVPSLLTNNTQTSSSVMLTNTADEVFDFNNSTTSRSADNNLNVDNIISPTTSSNDVIPLADTVASVAATITEVSSALNARIIADTEELRTNGEAIAKLAKQITDASSILELVVRKIDSIEEKRRIRKLREEQRAQQAADAEIRARELMMLSSTANAGVGAGASMEMTESLTMGHSTMMMLGMEGINNNNTNNNNTTTTVSMAQTDMTTTMTGPSLTHAAIASLDDNNGDDGDTNTGNGNGNGNGNGGSSSRKKKKVKARLSTTGSLKNNLNNIFKDYTF
jgi:hypothetical protein